MEIFISVLISVFISTLLCFTFCCFKLNSKFSRFEIEQELEQLRFEAEKRELDNIISSILMESKIKTEEKPKDIDDDSSTEW